MKDMGCDQDVERPRWSRGPQQQRELGTTKEERKGTMVEQMQLEKGGIGLLWVLTKERVSASVTVMTFQAEKREQGAVSVVDTSERRVAPMAEMSEREASITAIVELIYYNYI